jgi:hypothetical protein
VAGLGRTGPGCRFGPIPFDSLIEDHMKYMLLIYDDEKAWSKFSDTERQQYMGEYMVVQTEAYIQEGD